MLQDDLPKVYDVDDFDAFVLQESVGRKRSLPTFSVE
jgi:hypothetical protein